MTKKLQIIIHRYYDTIKLALLVVTLILAALIFLAVIQSSSNASKARQQSITQIVKAIQEESESQTDIINRQFRAICFLIIETAGHEALKQLDEETRARCENLAIEEAGEQAQGQQSLGNMPQNNTFVSPSSSQNTPNSSNQQQENPQGTQPPPETPEPPQSIIPFVEEPILGCPIGKLCL